MNLREAAQQALEQLKINRTNFRKGPSKSISKMLAGGNDEIIANLEAALAEPAQEPVAEVVEDEFSRQVVGIGRWQKLPNGTKLYTAPPRCPNCASLEEQNTELDRKLARHFCERCGKRLSLDGVHTCTPPQQAEPVQEPVAKVELMTTGGNAGLATRIVEIDDHLRERLRPGQLLYTVPPQRKPLTEEEMQKLAAPYYGAMGFRVEAFGRAVERAHRVTP